jgi:hypothetical protein
MGSWSRRDNSAHTRPGQGWRGTQGRTLGGLVFSHCRGVFGWILSGSRMQRASPLRWLANCSGDQPNR